MIVPDFKLKQNETHIIVYIRIPYIKVSACQFYIESQTFKFYLKPYLLSLTFEQPLKQAEEPSKAIYYHEKYTLEVHLQKQNTGEHFKNLDLLGSILNNKKKKKNKVKVEVVGSEMSSVVVQETESSVNHYNYGFGINYSDVLDNLEQQTAELFQFDPKTIALPQRLALSEQILIKQFDYDSYLFDKYDNSEEIKALMSNPEVMQHIEEQVKSRQGSSINNSEFKLKMKGKEILINKSIQQNIWTQITSIVFSYLYELICIGGDFGVQSAKTINRTSLVLSCHFYYHQVPLRKVLINCYKRCLTFSLYKSLLICKQAKNILTKVLSRKYLIAILLEIRKIFQNSEPRYLLNQLFIDDYLLFLYEAQSLNVLQAITKEIESINIDEENLQLRIKQYEQMESEQQEKQQVADLTKQFDKMNTLD